MGRRAISPTPRWASPDRWCSRPRSVESRLGSITTSRRTPWARSHRWRTSAASRHVGRARRSNASTPRPAVSGSAGGATQMSVRPAASRRRASRGSDTPTRPHEDHSDEWAPASRPAPLSLPQPGLELASRPGKRHPCRNNACPPASLVERRRHHWKKPRQLAVESTRVLRRPRDSPDAGTNQERIERGFRGRGCR